MWLLGQLFKHIVENLVAQWAIFKFLSDNSLHSKCLLAHFENSNKIEIGHMGTFLQ